MKKQHEKMILWSIIVISVLSVVPLLHLSMYNHPSGDDYWYASETYHAWRDTHSLWEVCRAAFCNFSRVLPDLAGTLRLRGDTGTGARYFWRSVVSDRCVSDSGGSVWRESDFCMAGAAQKA